MTHNKANKTKMLTLILTFTACLALMLGIATASAFVARADEGEKTTIESVGVSFNKTKISDELASMFQFEDEATKTLVVPEGANYTARIEVIFAYGHTRRLWSDAPGYLWSTIEDSEITRDTPYVVRVRFEPKTGYIFDASKEAEYLSAINIPGFEIGKGKDIEVWTSNLGEYYFTVDFVVTKGMNHMFGWSLNAYPKIGEPVNGSLSTAYTDTAFWLVGAPAPYKFEKKIAPVGTIVETQKSEILNTYVCNYQITAVNAMDGGTMYITATAADGQTCDIPIQVHSVSGGHEHTWVEKIEPIGNDHHGYTKCTAEDCPGVAYQFDKGSRYSTHDYAYGCNVECGTCGHVNPEGKHTYIRQFDVEDKEYHISKCRCGEVEKDENGNPVKEKHHGGKATCFIGAKCEVCDEIYTEKMEHRYIFTNPDLSLSNIQFKMCYYCGTEETGHRHIASGGTATCNRRAVCTHEGCGWEYGDFINHTFSDGKCTVCGADEVVNRVVIEVPYFTKGTPVSILEYPLIKEGRVFHAINSNFASYTRRDGGGGFVDKNGVIEQTVVMRYNFLAQANCKINPDVNEIDVVAENGEVVYKEYSPSSGYFTVCVLLRLDNTVPSVEIEVPQPYGGNDVGDFKIIEKNGMEVTVLEWSGLSNYYTGNFVEGKNAWALLKITAPEGEKFPPTVNQVSMWLSEMHLSGAGFVVDRIDVNDEGTEATIRIELPKALPCPHKESTLKEAGKPETCTENGVKDKYACKSCGKEFSDAACTEEWDPTDLVIPAAHKCQLVEAVAVTPADADGNNGKDGNVEYYVCLREKCGKRFADAACSSEITLEQTIIHDFKTEWSSNKDKHYHECKNCDVIKDETAHRPDRTEATEDDPVKCLDCGYVIEPALAHTTHHTTLVPGEDATCMKEGKKPYYRCDGCEVKFEDESATKPIVDESSLVIAKAHKFGAWVAEVPATEETEGVKGHKDCAFCKKHFDENGEEIADLTIAKLVKAEVAVVGGTGGGRLTVGEMVTVTANDPAEGKVFKGWKDESGTTVSADKSYTFKVTGATTLTAVYEDIAPTPTPQPGTDTKPTTKKQGLSGGQIAGIVVGSAAVAGVGGFAIFWFAVKKKSFADLISAIKALFTKKK